MDGQGRRDLVHPLGVRGFEGGADTLVQSDPALGGNAVVYDLPVQFVDEGIVSGYHFCWYFSAGFAARRNCCGRVSVSITDSASSTPRFQHLRHRSAR